MSAGGDVTVELDHEDRDAIIAVLMGRRVVKVEDDELTLDNGVQLIATGNEGCGGCSNGEYNLTSLSRVDNAITAVEFEYSHEAEEPGFFRIFVFAGDERINLMEFEGSDGNGWYGTGFSLLVRGLWDVRESTKASTVGQVEEVVGAAVSPLPPAAPAAELVEQLVRDITVFTVTGGRLTGALAAYLVDLGWRR